jgi:hypothetical protein
MSITSSFDHGVFAQEEKIRCTSGDLVSSPGQCPSTDECPSAPSGTGIAQCSLRESPETEGEPDASSNANANATASTMSVETDKETYDQGEPVKVIIRNNGDQPFRVSGLDFSLTIMNSATNENYSLIERPASILAVDADTSRTYHWDQLNDEGEQVGAGNYTAALVLGPFHGNATFSIS